MPENAQKLDSFISFVSFGYFRTFHWKSHCAITELSNTKMSLQVISLLE